VAKSHRFVGVRARGAGPCCGTDFREAANPVRHGFAIDRGTNCARNRTKLADTFARLRTKPAVLLCMLDVRPSGDGIWEEEGIKYVEQLTYYTRTITKGLARMARANFRRHRGRDENDCAQAGVTPRPRASYRPAKMPATLNAAPERADRAPPIPDETRSYSMSDTESPSDAETSVVRTWLRDGTQNLMTLGQAIDNLVHNQADADNATEDRREAIRRYLLAGRTLRTAHATFALET
jgi:hypothetical protein